MNNLPSTTQPRLYFRADGDARQGLGHVVRTLALADRLRGLAPGTFVVRAPSPAVAALVAAENWPLHPLPADVPLPAEADWLATHLLRPADVLVLDGYDFGPDYQRQLLASGCRLLVIDDLLTRPVLAQVLLNHSPGLVAADYNAPAHTQLLLGPAHALLRRPFLAAAAPPTPPAAIGSVLVCFGGADPLGLTERTLRALRNLPRPPRLGLVVGGAFAHLPALQAAVAEAGAPATIYQQVDAPGMVHLLQAHDAVVAPASTVLIEALVLGRPALTGHYAANQRELARYVAAHDQAFSVGDFTALSTDSLAAALARGLAWLAATPRRPYAGYLRPGAVREAVRQLLSHG